MKALPILSVVIPNWNHGRFIEDCIRSHQVSGISIEIIVIDDASDDDSISILRRLQKSDNRIRLIANETRIGVVRAMNKGIEASSGKYILMRAADDLSVPSSIQGAIELLETHASAGLSCGDLGYFLESPIDATIEPLCLSPIKDYISPESLAGMLEDSPIHSHTSIYRKSALLDIGLFKEAHQFYSDWYATTLIASKYGLCYQPTCTALARLSSNSFANAGAKERSSRENIYSELIQDFKALPKELLATISRSRALEFFGIDASTALGASYQAPAPPSKRWKQAGMGAAIHKKVSLLKPLIARDNFLPNVYIYGAGKHTRLLLKSWAESPELPPPLAIWVTEVRQNEPSINGIPVLQIGQLPSNAAPDVIIVSSKSYEPAMKEEAARRYPKSSIITFWGAGDRNAG